MREVATPPDQYREHGYLEIYDEYACKRCGGRRSAEDSSRCLGPMCNLLRTNNPDHLLFPSDHGKVNRQTIAPLTLGKRYRRTERPSKILKPQPVSHPPSYPQAKRFSCITSPRTCRISLSFRICRRLQKKMRSWFSSLSAFKGGAGSSGVPSDPILRMVAQSSIEADSTGSESPSLSGAAS